MMYTKQIKRKLYRLNSNGYIYPSGCTTSDLAYTLRKRGKQYGMFECPYCYDGDCDKCNYWGFTNKEYILRLATKRREGLYVSCFCINCNGGGYVPDPARRLSWRGDRMCKCNKCDFGRVWYKYNLHTKKWINQSELYA